MDVALLVVGAFIAAAISGSAGLGGALLLLPLRTRAACRTPMRELESDHHEVPVTTPHSRPMKDPG